MTKSLGSKIAALLVGLIFGGMSPACASPVTIDLSEYVTLTFQDVSPGVVDLIITADSNLTGNQFIGGKGKGAGVFFNAVPSLNLKTDKVSSKLVSGGPSGKLRQGIDKFTAGTNGTFDFQMLFPTHFTSGDSVTFQLSDELGDLSATDFLATALGSSQFAVAFIQSPCPGKKCVSGFYALDDEPLTDGGGQPAPVPLPATLPLFASGLAGLGWLGRRKRRRSA